MMKNNNIKKIIIVIVIILVFVGGYILLDKIINNDTLGYDEYLKNYEVNEYIATYVSDEDMAKIYLNDYIHNMYYDIEHSYNSLDEEYKNKKFGSLESYKNYVNGLTYTSYSVARYYKKEENGYIIFYVYDQNENFFAFKTKGVMQYKVYLDNYTIEI